jgi:MYXO-CTERM domain-containing protein
VARQRPDTPVLGLLAALFAAAALLLILGWPLTFFQDTWAVLLERPGVSAHSLLAPHNEHLIVIPVGIEKVLVAVFGMSSAHPELIVMTATVLATAVLLFVYVRRRVGAWPALLATVLLLFLGSAWQVILWPFQITFVGSTMAGIAALLVLDRDDSRGDFWACLFLVVSIGFGSIGLSFVIAAFVDVFCKQRTRGLRRLYVPILPLLLYAAWYAGWGHDAEHHLTLENVLRSPSYTFEGFANAVGSLAGLSNATATDPGSPDWGRPLLVLLIGLAGYALWRRPRIADTFWPVAAAALSYWLLAAFNFVPGREPTSFRYVYGGAVFVLLIAAEVLQGVRFSRRVLWVAAAATVLAVLPNLAQLRDGANWLEEQTLLTRADTAALEISSRTVEPTFTLLPDVAGTPSLININAEKFLPVAREDGSPAYSPAELAKAPEAARRQADIVLSQALPLSTETVSGGAGGSGSATCQTVPPGGAPPQGLQLAPGLTRIEIAAGPEAGFKLRRFAVAEFPVPTEQAAGGSTVLLRIPRDRARQSWYLQPEAQQTVRICR